MKVDTVVVLLIFCVFASSVFLVLMLGGSTYQNMINISNEGQNERIVVSYIRTKIRNTDSADSISVGTFDGHSTLFIEENFGGSTFVTLIYLYNGWVKELFHEKGQNFLPQDGMPIIRADSLAFEELSGGLIRVITDYGSLIIYPRSSTLHASLGAVVQ